MTFLKFLVPVLCLCEEGHYKNAFKFFAENNMNFEVIWLNSWDYGSKFLLLCDVVSRIPEDVQYVLYKLKIDGKILLTIHFFSMFNKQWLLLLHVMQCCNIRVIF